MWRPKIFARFARSEFRLILVVISPTKLHLPQMQRVETPHFRAQQGPVGTGILFPSCLARKPKATKPALPEKYM